MTGRLRVLQVVPYFPPDRIGGVGEVAAHLHRSLLAAGHDSRVFTAGTTYDDARIRRVGTQPLGFVLKCVAAIDLVRNSDIVHCHQGDSLLLLLAMRVARVHTPVLATFHVSSRGLGRAVRPHRIEGYRFGTRWRNYAYRYFSAPVHRAFDWMTLRLCSRASFISRSAARDVLGESESVDAHVIYNALPTGDTNDRQPSLPPADLLFVGTPGDRKRVNALPFVLRRVRDVRPDVRLRIIGFRLDDHGELRGLFDRFHLRDAVVCEGALTSDEVRPFYRASKVLLVPSAYEGLPMVVLEAQQAGLPCVATRVSGHPEVIEDGVNGFLVTLDSPDDMAARCLDILADPHLQQQMGDNARNLIAERFSPRRQLDEYVALYRLVSGPKRRHS